MRTGGNAFTSGQDRPLAGHSGCSQAHSLRSARSLNPCRLTRAASLPSSRTMPGPLRGRHCDTPTMRAVAAVMRLPVLTRFFVVGAVCTGAAGCVAGLAIGLLVYPPTAWFAIFELGIPAAIVGGIVGLLSGAVVLAVRGSRHRNRVR
jgi:hypothetical protein